jgi:hydrogenase maturation protease
MRSKGIDLRRVLIVGYGNPLRADDGFGWQAARHLAALLQDAPIEILALHQLTPELAEPISRASLIIFIDATHKGQPGSWRCERLELNTTLGNSLAHHFTPRSLLAYAQAIFEVSPAALVVSVAGESYAYSEQLTPRVGSALAQVIEHVREQIARLREQNLCMSTLS